jgi:YHS domain-containing protein
MKRIYLATFLITMTLGAAPLTAQPPQQMPAQSAGAGMPSAELVSACVDAQQQVAALATRVNGRLEDARQTNSPQEMRAALADLQATLVEIRARAAQCSPLQAAAQTADPHAGHAIPGTPQKQVAPGTPVVQPGSTTPAPGAPDPHAGHSMPATKAPSEVKSTAKPADPHAGHATRPARKAAPSKPAAKPADPHAGHDTGKPASKLAGKAPAAKPVSKQILVQGCDKPIDPATAPSTTYKGVTYYFCSAEDRLRFIRNPETFLKKKGPQKQ